MEQSRFQHLASQYIERTLIEVAQMQELLQRAPEDQSAKLQLQQLAHRINGSGALLGFASISLIAAEVERLLRQSAAELTVEDWQHLGMRLSDMQQELQAIQSASLPSIQ